MYERYANNTKKNGLTIAELVIVIGVVAVAVPAVFGIFFSVLYGKSKVNILQEVKRNGDTAVNVMRHLVQNNAVSIYTDETLNNEVCSTKSSLSTPSTASGTLYFRDSLENYFYFSLNGDRIASNSGTLTYLTNNKVTVSNLTVSCSRASSTYNSSPIVSITFTLAKSGAAGRQEEITSLTYSRKIKLRN